MAIATQKTPMRIASEDKPKGMSKRVALTGPLVDVAACPAGKNRVWIYDTRLPGLALMVTAAGSKAFYLYRKVNGAPQRYRLGGFPDITVEQARTSAREKAGEIAKGVDPMQEKRRLRAKTLTLGELFEWFLEHWAKPRKRSWKDDQNRYNKHLKLWAARKLSDIAPGDVATLHQRVAAATSQTTSNRVLALLSTMFNKAKVPLKLTSDNPCKGVEKFAEQSRERFLSAEELERFFTALESDEVAVDWRDFFKLALFTGARRGNLLSMRWEELDLTAGTWSIPAAKFKNKKAAAVHLTVQAVAILSARQNKSQWVFPSYSRTGHLVKPDFAWTELCRLAKLTELRIHDLRRTLGSWQAAGNTSHAIIGKSLGHQSQQATAIYSRLQLDPVRKSVNAAVAAMVAAGKPMDDKTN